MAENSGKDVPQTDPKSQDNKGPVRPPVLEGTARPATGAKPADGKPQPSRPEPPKSDQTKPEQAKLDPAKTARPPSAPPTEQTRSSGGSPWLAGLLGAVLGLGAAYGLASAGLWPAQQPVNPPADPRLAQFATAIPELETGFANVRSEVEALTGRLSTLEDQAASVPAGDTADAALVEQVAALQAQLEDLAARPAASTETSPVPALNQQIAALETELAQLRQTIETSVTDLAETRSTVSGLAETTAALSAAGDQASRLPLVFSSLESAFASGRTFETELDTLRRVLPDVTIPQNVSAAASVGLPQPDIVARRLNGIIPDMLAGRPANADASFQDGAMDWFRGVIAMRPSGAIEGDSPEAQVSQLEAAMARRDYAQALAIFQALPASMQAVGEGLAGDLALLATSQTFLDDLRDAALRAETGA
ncbi:COG4223 family protein [Devosia chinhatensis]|uniref:Uncharacterized protein n=1 Tax=Devosia chinhatensis TaxID=429727 RepID=A0A0F5FHS6_9HYPH|nr:hypothetical protein [Devosia chinhatensis]KKB07752.1 hypothetical protein VE26_13900 [Devosia chinhatensis]